MTTSDAIRSSLSELAWSLWAQLGVSGWGRTHETWLVDPEPLIVFTAWLGEEDVRLRDEATDWCVRFAPMISATRLINLQGRASVATRERVAELARVVSAHSSVRWSLARPLRQATASRDEQRRPFEPTNRSNLESLSTPARLSLRLRAIFGVGARAEVMRALLEPPGTPCSAADLADETAFKKRNVAAALEMMHKAGVVESQKVRKELRFQLAQAGAWRQLLGATPEVWPRWHHILPLLADVLDALDRVQPLTPKVQAVELRRLAEGFAARAMKAQLNPPPSVVGTDALAEWLAHSASSLGRADISIFRDVDERGQALRDAIWWERAKRHVGLSRARLQQLRDEHSYDAKDNPGGRLLECPACSAESVAEAETDVGVCTEWKCREIHRLRRCPRCEARTTRSEGQYCEGCTSYIGRQD